MNNDLADILGIGSVLALLAGMLCIVAVASYIMISLVAIDPIVTLVATIGIGLVVLGLGGLAFVIRKADDGSIEGGLDGR